MLQVTLHYGDQTKIGCGIEALEIITNFVIVFYWIDKQLKNIENDSLLNGTFCGEILEWNDRVCRPEWNDRVWNSSHCYAAA